MNELGPVSRMLEAEVRSVVRKHGVVVWLDGEGTYSGFVDRLQSAGDRPFEVHAYRGSYLELMLALEHAAGGADRPPLLLHMPRHTEESIRSTPLLELYRPGRRFRKKLATLVTEAAAGEVAPERVAAFLQPDGGVTLEGADLWLEAIQVEREGGLRSQLQVMSISALVDDLLTRGAVAERLTDEEARAALFDRVVAMLGLSAAWRRLAPEDKPEDVAFIIGSWALAIEYVHDLSRPTLTPILEGLGALAKPLVEACRALARHLRAHQPMFYKTLATEVEGWLPEETQRARAEDLGKIDTFRFEEDRVLQEALDRLADNCAMSLAWAVLGRGLGVAHTITIGCGSATDANRIWNSTEPQDTGSTEVPVLTTSLTQAQSVVSQSWFP